MKLVLALQPFLPFLYSLASQFLKKELFLKFHYAFLPRLSQRLLPKLSLRLLPKLLLRLSLKLSLPRSLRAGT